MKESTDEQECWEYQAPYHLKLCELFKLGTMRHPVTAGGRRGREILAHLRFHGIHHRVVHVHLPVQNITELCAARFELPPKIIHVPAILVSQRIGNVLIGKQGVPGLLMAACPKNDAQTLFLKNVCKK